MRETSGAPLQITLIGGGFSGGALALHLAQASRHQIPLFEVRAKLGQMRHFAQNPPQDADLYAPSGEPYPRRAVFAAFMAHEISPYLASGRLKSIAPDATVLVVGNGFTAGDTIASLSHLDPKGAITSLSRRALPLKSRRQIARHLRAFWDVHRFRIAPQIEALLGSAIAQGRLDRLAAHLTSGQRATKGQGSAISYLARHAKAAITKVFDALLVTTGPAHGGTFGALMGLPQVAQAAQTLCNDIITAASRLSPALKQKAET